MLTWAKCLSVSFAASLVAGCTATAPVADGAGFSLLTPSPQTRQFIISNDRPFAGQVVGHNRTCERLPGCSK